MDITVLKTIVGITCFIPFKILSFFIHLPVNKIYQNDAYNLVVFSLFIKF